LTGIGAHLLDDGINRCAETPAEARSLVLVPALRAGQIGVGAWGRRGRVD
jgi:hypothetical protein